MKEYVLFQFQPIPTNATTNLDWDPYAEFATIKTYIFQ